MGASNYVNLQPVGYQLLTATSATSAGLTVPTPSAGQTTADLALIVAETAAIRWRDDPATGGSVNATSGNPLPVGTYMEYDGPLSGPIRFAAQTGTATIHVTYYRAN